MNKKKLYLFMSIALLGLTGLVSAQSVQLNDPLGIGPRPDAAYILLWRIINGVGMVIASLGTIMIIVAGILYLTSAGSPDRMTTARKALMYAIIGIAIGVSASVIANIIVDILKKGNAP